MAKYGIIFHYIQSSHQGSRVVDGEIPEDRGIGSVFGPCIQSVVITWIDPEISSVDVFWRSTEWFRKLPADLILITYFLLPPFQLKEFDINCHFANITVHQMTFISFIPSLPDPIATLDLIKSKDPSFHRIVVRKLNRTLSAIPSRFGRRNAFAGQPATECLTPIGSSNISQRSDYDRRFSRMDAAAWSWKWLDWGLFLKANGDRWLVQFTHWPKRPALYSAAAIAARREILPMVAR